MSESSAWPDLPLSAWSETCETLHRWTQIAGKVRMALTPQVNHWWNVTLYVTARGLGTSAIPYGPGAFEIIFDFVDHRLRIDASDGRSESFALAPMTVKDFYLEFMRRLQRLDIKVHIWTMPSEIENAVPFDQDVVHAQYDPVYAQRFWRALLQADRVMKAFRAGFIGKVSPVHFFWGSFDLAVSRFSGRPALPPSAAAPSWVREAYSHEVSSCGFWPGGAGMQEPIFYAYAYPPPPGFSEAPVRPEAAYYNREFGEFILPYDAVRQAAQPDAALLDFLQTSYAAAADRGRWDRSILESAPA